LIGSGEIRLEIEKGKCLTTKRLRPEEVLRHFTMAVLEEAMAEREIGYPLVSIERERRGFNG
jgi:hypothetical protein